ncbi:YhbY family RNA-binding protein [Bifidobacterium bombi]|uniref:CRS1 / YhbY (CRM) domain n=1 Tax=Bifidobacterium bombi DSM 19703 TaxID=1341695 RepID=A0A080N2V5_9BIFI|nr:YhbY family RNA-binding protein [Bifidobacterium bombi]KFF31221.1 CRS1 / YhbY (CRM) domain [Bifidobacterium bombi DSM 19703]
MEMSQKKLNKRQIRQLRGLANKLEPMLWIGSNGLTDAIVRQASETLESHELLKCALQESCPVDEKEVSELLSGQIGAQVIQVIGHRFVLYRPTQKPGVKTIDLVR